MQVNVLLKMTFLIHTESMVLLYGHISCLPWYEVLSFIGRFSANLSLVKRVFFITLQSVIFTGNSPLVGDSGQHDLFVVSG